MTSRTAWTSGNGAGIPSNGTLTQVNGNELVSLASGSSALLTGVPVTTQAASGTWTTSSTSITLSAANGSIAAGQIVFDNTVGVGGYIGIVSSYNSGTPSITLVAAAAHASSGSSDTLAFSLPIANGPWNPGSLAGYFDQFCDLFGEFTVGSATPTIGAGFAFYLAYLQKDGVTWGSGELTPGSSMARAPQLPVVASPSIQTAGATTLLVGDNGPNPIVLRPRAFLPVLYNGSTITLSSTASNSYVGITTYNQTLNN